MILHFCQTDNCFVLFIPYLPILHMRKTQQANRILILISIPVQVPKYKDEYQHKYKSSKKTKTQNKHQ